MVKVGITMATQEYRAKWYSDYSEVQTMPKFSARAR